MLWENGICKHFCYLDLLTVLGKSSKETSPKWWFNGDLYIVVVTKNHLTQIQDHLDISAWWGKKKHLKRNLVGGFNPLEKYALQLGSFLHLEVNIKIKHTWNHHLPCSCLRCFFAFYHYKSPSSHHHLGDVCFTSSKHRTSQIQVSMKITLKSHFVTYSMNMTWNTTQQRLLLLLLHHYYYYYRWQKHLHLYENTPNIYHLLCWVFNPTTKIFSSQIGSFSWMYGWGVENSQDFGNHHLL